jgi:hypothetical protein
MKNKNMHTRESSVLVPKNPQSQGEHLARLAYGHDPGYRVGLREMFAGQAMVWYMSIGMDYHKVARQCWHMADVMIDEMVTRS